MPKKQKIKKEERDAAVTLATKHAIDIPLKPWNLSMILTLSKNHENW